MLKIWLVTFSNGEEYHLFGERSDVIRRACAYAVASDNGSPPVVTYLRWLKG